jgi:hypothetical protein
MELSRPHSKAIDLVVKNLGKTAALEVRVEVEPVPIRAAGNQRGEVWLPEQVPVLVPEQEWRTFWDLTTAREAPELQGRHTAVVTYRDTHGGDFKFEYLLDWAPALNRGLLVVYDTHDSAKALREINETFKRLRRFLEGRGEGEARGAGGPVVVQGQGRSATAARLISLCGAVAPSHLSSR